MIMEADRRLMLSFALACLLCSLAPHYVSGTADVQDDESTESLFASGRHLQQYQTPCNISWQYVSNFTILTDACPLPINSSESYPKKACCDGLADLLCPYAAQVNDPNSLCSSSFWATVQLVAPNYTNAFFDFICTDDNSPNGIECPNGSLGNSSPSGSSPSFAPRQGSYSFGLTLLVAVAVFEILVLLF